MPDRVHIASTATYTLKDRLLSHWYAGCVTLGGGGLGLAITVAGLVRWLHPAAHPALAPPCTPQGWEKWLNPAPSLATLPAWQSPLVGVFLLLGAVLWFRATISTYQYVEDFWKVQRAGLLLLILGWLSYSFCAFSARPEWVVPWWVGVSMAVAHTGGFLISLLHEWRLLGKPAWVSCVGHWLKQPRGICRRDRP